MDKFTPIHLHLLLKATVRNTKVSAEDGKNFLKSLVEAIGMVPVTEPQCVVVTFPGNEGPTGSINLATSHIAFHLWEDTRLLMLHVYSCKSFDPAVVLKVVNDIFDLETEEVVLLDRETMRRL